jgi:hypothetical protein
MVVYEPKAQMLRAPLVVFLPRGAGADHDDGPGWSGWCG